MSKCRSLTNEKKIIINEESHDWNSHLEQELLLLERNLRYVPEFLQVNMDFFPTMTAVRLATQNITAATKEEKQKKNK